MKSKGNTPKYGLIFHSSFIGRADAKNKGRISRYLANKAAMASRIDAFSDISSAVYGSKMREQVEERLRFFESGKAPRKNLAVMAEASAEVAAAAPGEDGDAEDVPVDLEESDSDAAAPAAAAAVETPVDAKAARKAAKAAKKAAKAAKKAAKKAATPRKHKKRHRDETTPAAAAVETPTAEPPHKKSRHSVCCLAACLH